ncbi:MAG: EAL domain-containing protein [Betaproteobacteria bacterium]|nr:EAL domain-containing protein [Betaproteobacteria bacterium]
MIMGRMRQPRAPGSLGSVLAAIAIVTGLAVSIFGYHAWHAVTDELTGRATDLARLGARATTQFYERFDGALANLVDELQEEGGLDSSSRAERMLARTAAATVGLGRIVLLDESGRTVADSRGADAEPLAPDLLQGIGGGGPSRLEIGRPLRESAGGDWIVPICLGVTRGQGVRPFTLVATTRILSQWQLVGELGTLPGWVIAVQRDDGFLQGRWPPPDDSSQIFSRRVDSPPGATPRDRPGQDPGHVFGPSPAEGDARLYASHRVSEFPFTVFVTLPEGAVFAAWLERVRLPLLLFVLVALGSVWGYRRFATQQALYAEEVARRRFRLELLHALTADAYEAVPQDTIVQRTVSRLQARFPHLRVSYVEVTDDGRFVVVVSNAASALPTLRSRTFSAARSEAYLRELRAGRAVVSASRGRETGHAFPAAREAPAFLDVAVGTPDNGLGILCLDAGQPRHWEDFEVETLREVATQLGLMLRNAHAERLRVAAEERLRTREARFRGLAELSSDWFWESDAEHRLVFQPEHQWHPVLTERGLSGYEGLRRWELPGFRTEPGVLDDHWRALAARLPFRDFEYARTVPDGSVHYVSVSGTPHFGEGGEFLGYQGVGRDITERRLAEHAVRESEALFSAVFNSSRDALFLGDIADGRIFDCNPRAVALFHAPSREYILGRPGHALLRRPLSRSELASRLARLDRGETIQEDLKFRTHHGEDFWGEMLASRLDLPGKRAYVVRVADITERKAAEDRIRYLAQHDALTGLPNRAFLHQALAHAIERARRGERRLALIFMDLDRFKLINDSLGHGAGDLVLQQMAMRLRAALRASDTVARQGGDEFVVLVEEFRTEKDLAGVVAKLLEVCSQPFTIEEREFALTVSAGISTFPEDGMDIDTLFKAADSAMYRAKDTGRNTYRFYSPQLTAPSLERLSLETALKRAIERGELCLYYQPKLEISTGTVTGAEALVRWRHPEHGLLLPAQFVPLAEDNGLIVELGAWVLSEACRQAAVWVRAGFRDFVMAVNLSGRQFLQGDVLARVTRALRDVQLDPASLELELTESTVMSNPEIATDTLSALTRLGVSIAIDDFGTGYSSLAYLKRFPVSTLKIDQSFVQQLPEDAENAAITQAVLVLARSLRLRVVAEGVESPGQLVFLASHGCDFAQGFCIAHPLPPEAFEDFLRQHGGPVAETK